MNETIQVALNPNASASASAHESIASASSSTITITSASADEAASINSFNNSNSTSAVDSDSDFLSASSNNSEFSSSIIPRSACSLFLHQVGGHQYSCNDNDESAAASLYSDPGPGMLKYRSSVLKPTSDSRKCRCEKDFYSYAAHPPALKRFLPSYRGLARVAAANSSSPPFNYLSLADLTDGFKYPCIIDIKMGTKTYDEEASAIKSAGDRRKYAHQETLGMRVIGIKLFDFASGEWLRKEKSWGRELDESNFHVGLQFFFHKFARSIIPIVLERLEELSEWFESQTDYRFYSSSLLILYENSIDSDVVAPSQVRLCMVDFTHVFGPARQKFFSLHDDSLNNSGLHTIPNQRDEGYIHGLRNLKQMLKKILKESQ